jgi:hypothetical protein
VGGGIFINGAMVTFDIAPTGNMVAAGAAAPGGLGGLSAATGLGGAGAPGGMGGNGGLPGSGGTAGIDGLKGPNGNPGMPGNPGQAGSNGGAGMKGLAIDPDIYMGGGGGAAAPGAHQRLVLGLIATRDVSPWVSTGHAGSHLTGSSQPANSGGLAQSSEGPPSPLPASVRKGVALSIADFSGHNSDQVQTRPAARPESLQAQDEWFALQASFDPLISELGSW